MPTGFRVLLHAPFYTSLRKQPAARIRRFRRLLTRLSAGHWDGGTRVKKLQGVAKPVFEARQDDTDRALFTLGHSASSQHAGQLRAHVLIWDLVHHDRVTSRASRINPSAEAEFLDYQQLESEVIAEPPPHPAASFAEIPAAEPGGEAGVLEFMLTSSEFRHTAREELAGGVRWYVVPDRLLAGDDEWQELVDRGADELELKLTGEQYDVVRAPGPVLLSGSAGSGKTTIAVHRLAAASCGTRPASVLYSTYSPWLLDHARRLFHDILLCRGDTPGTEPGFLTMDDLYRTLISRHGGKAPDRVTGYSDFLRWYARATAGAGGEPELAWEEIRSIVKGACLDPRRSMLHRGEYEALGRKRAPIFTGERERLYPLAKKWQKHLRETGRLDEIDLCRLALRALRPDDAYDHVICDEVQDLAEIQVHLLLRLHRGAAFRGLFLTGDSQQVINPSGFRWGEVRSAIREAFKSGGRPAPRLHSLTHNFRSVRPLVELANEILALKRERTGRSEGDESEESMVAGATPVLVDGVESALAEVAAGFGPRCAVVVGSADQRDRLRELLQTTRIFTAQEAKGLEFDVVILWGFLAANPGPWRDLLDPEPDLREDPACRRALHHLYVAVTRARRHLAVYEPPDTPPLWTSARFAAHLDAAPPDSLSRLFARAAAPAEWLREAEYFLERGHLRQAAECFRRAGEERRAHECLARHHESSGQGKEAARHWLALEQKERAARCFQQAGCHLHAARLWTEMGRAEAAEHCRIRKAEQDRRWKSAAAGWEKLARWEEAARCWSHASQRKRQVRCLARAAEEAGRHADAARHWQEIGALSEATAAWKKAGRAEEAHRAEAEGHEAARRWSQAAGAWEKAGERCRALRCRAEAAGKERRWREAAPLWEELGQFDLAARCWKRGQSPAEAARCAARAHLAGGRYLKAAEAFEKLDEFASAAEAWERAHVAGQQPRKVTALPLPVDAVREWVPSARTANVLKTSYRWDGGNLVRTIHDARTRARVCGVRAAENSGRFDEAEKLWRAMGDEDQAFRCRVTWFQREGQPAKAAALLEEKKLLVAAREAWKRLKRTDDAERCHARILEKRGRYKQAVALWERLGSTHDASRCRGRMLLKQREYAAAAISFDEAGEERRALDARLLEAQERCDLDGAARLLRDAGQQEEMIALLRRRRSWMQKGRRMAAAAGRRLTAGTPREARPQPTQTPLFEIERQDTGTPTAPLLAEPATVRAAVHDSPGMTCIEIQRKTGTLMSTLQPLLRELWLQGVIAKSGRTRGTRYWPREEF